MKPRRKPIIAIIYDFDGTLIPGNMQEHSFIPGLGMDKSSFWKEVKERAKKHDMDEVLAYMQLMIEKAKGKKQPFNKTWLRKQGQSLEFFPGVETWFGEIKKYVRGGNATVRHYIISSGLDDMIQGSGIGRHFKHIFASGFMYDPYKGSEFPARSINYTTKVQYLFRINKGISNSWDNSKINKFTPKDKRPIPFSRMIYIGDGYTDVPSMKMMNYKGGYSIAVYPPRKGESLTKNEKKKRQEVRKLQKDNRCQFIAEADYSKDKTLYKIVTSLIDRISNEHIYKMKIQAK